MFRVPVAYPRVILVAAATAALGGCSSTSYFAARETDERQCLARAMYFESNRSSDDGMMAVGTVVMNRVESGRYGHNICSVVGAPRQFAPGVLTKPMTGVGRKRALKNADRVLAGQRYPGLSGVEFFHTAGYSYPYSNMQYRLVAGGNAFYEKRYLRPGEAPQTQVAALQRSRLGLAPPETRIANSAFSQDFASLDGYAGESDESAPPKPAPAELAPAEPMPLPPERPAVASQPLEQPELGSPSFEGDLAAVPATQPAYPSVQSIY